MEPYSHLDSDLGAGQSIEHKEIKMPRTKRDPHTAQDVEKYYSSIPGTMSIPFKTFSDTMVTDEHGTAYNVPYVFDGASVLEGRVYIRMKNAITGDRNDILWVDVDGNQVTMSEKQRAQLRTDTGFLYIAGRKNPAPLYMRARLPKSEDQQKEEAALALKANLERIRRLGGPIPDDVWELIERLQDQDDTAEDDDDE